MKRKRNNDIITPELRQKLRAMDTASLRVTSAELGDLLLAMDILMSNAEYMLASNETSAFRGAILEATVANWSALRDKAKKSIELLDFMHHI